VKYPQLQHELHVTTSFWKQGICNGVLKAQPTQKKGHFHTAMRNFWRSFKVTLHNSFTQNGFWLGSKGPPTKKQVLTDTFPSSNHGLPLPCWQFIKF